MTPTKKESTHTTHKKKASTAKSTLKKKSQKITKKQHTFDRQMICSYTALIVAFASLGGFAFGYDLGVFGGASIGIKEALNLSDVDIEVVIAICKVGAMFGVFIGGVIMDTYGRKMAIANIGIFFLVGPFLQVVFPSFVLLILGRFITGLGIGASSIVVTAYLGEIAEKKWRGTIVASNELMLAFGMLIAPFVDYLFLLVPGNQWRWMIGIPCAFGFFILFAPFILPESPRWLVVTGKLQKGLSCIKKLRRHDVIINGRGDNSLYLHAGLSRFDKPSPSPLSARAQQELLELWSASEKEKEIKKKMYHEHGLNVSLENDMERGGNKQAHEQANSQSNESQSSSSTHSSSSIGDLDYNGTSLNDTTQHDTTQHDTTQHDTTQQTSLHCIGLRKWLIEFKTLWNGEEGPQFQLCIFLAIVNQLCGSTAVINYAPILLSSGKGNIEKTDPKVSVMNY